MWKWKQTGLKSAKVDRLRRAVVEDLLKEILSPANAGLRRAIVDDVIQDMMKPTNQLDQPNLNPLSRIGENVEISNLNLKFFGYDLARSISRTLAPNTDLHPRHVGLQSKASTQIDMESDWVAYWCGQLGIPVVMHRKLWELSYVLQAIYDHGSIREGARGLGFGCGEEPLPSYLASRGVGITVTDLAPDSPGSEGWAATGQHTASLDKSFQPHLIDRASFDRLVDLKFVDMNAIDACLRDYDFCWSVCAFEHLGTIAKGLSFVENSLETVRSGGLAVHTTEFNIAPSGPTFDNWGSVLFQREHFSQLAERLREQGHHVAELNFDIGDKPMDRFIDLPPWGHDLPPEYAAWHGGGQHLKVAMHGMISTCFGLVIVKRD